MKNHSCDTSRLRNSIKYTFNFIFSLMLKARWRQGRVSLAFASSQTQRCNQLFENTKNMNPLNKSCTVTVSGFCPGEGTPVIGQRTGSRTVVIPGTCALAPGEGVAVIKPWRQVTGGYGVEIKYCIPGLPCWWACFPNWGMIESSVPWESWDCALQFRPFRSRSWQLSYWVW